jgi:hypothetical protein
MTYGAHIAWLLVLFQAITASAGLSLAIINLLDTHEDLALAESDNGLNVYIAKHHVERESYIVAAMALLFLMSLLIVPIPPAGEYVTLRMVFNRFCLLVLTMLMSLRSFRVERHRHKILRDTWPRPVASHDI